MRPPLALPARLLQVLPMFFKKLPFTPVRSRHLKATGLLILIGAVLISPELFSAQKKRYPKISRITLRTTDVFDFATAPYLNKFPYNFINLLHTQTKEDVIQQELLFKVGEPADPFLIQETERNLRALPFINAARIAQFPQRDGTVALVVYVSDSWTTEPYASIGGANAIDKVKIGFKEKNLFGRGKQMEFSYDDKNDYEKILRYKDPRLFSSRWQLEAEELKSQKGTGRSFDITHPFFSADTRWSAIGSYTQSDTTLQELDNSVLVSEFEQHKETTEFGAGLKIGSGRRIVNRSGFRYKLNKAWYSKNENTNPDMPVPEKSTEKIVFLDWSTTRNKFLKLRRIDKMTRVEDFNLGPSIAFSPGQSVHALTGRDNTLYLETVYDQNLYSPERYFLKTHLSYSGRNTTRKEENEIYALDARYYHLTLPNQTLIFRSQIQYGNKLDPDVALTVGSKNGLRAFQQEERVGAKSLLFNVEDRLFLIDELWSLFSIGTVAYFDSGYAWSKGQSIDLTDMLNDIGVGLRVGMTRSSQEIIARMDFSYRLNKSRNKENEWVLSFGSGQAF